jgi:purine-cytosine permease-like protein
MLMPPASLLARSRLIACMRVGVVACCCARASSAGAANGFLALLRQWVRMCCVILVFYCFVLRRFPEIPPALEIELGVDR